MLATLKRLLEMPPKPRMRNLLLVGEPNNGKTTLVTRFRDHVGAAYIDDEGQSVKPVVLVESPPTPDERALYASILEQFAAPYTQAPPSPSSATKPSTCSGTAAPECSSSTRSTRSSSARKRSNARS